MAQTYTLDEAADKLNLSVEDFKRRLRTEWTQIRSFRDGNTLRFRANEIDELARMFGLGSSDELPLADSSETELPPAQLGAPADPGPLLGGPAVPADAATRADEAPLQLDDSDEMFLLTPDKPGASGRNLGKEKGDSDVRLEKHTARPPAPGQDDESIITEEFEVPPGGSGKLSGKSGKLSSAKLKSDSGKMKAGESGKQPAPPSKAMEDSSSEFELSLEPDSDEFELSLAPDSSDEVSLGEMPAAPPGSASKAGQSGINLNRPADSGVSLEKKPAGSDDEIDFELSLDAPGSGKSAIKPGSGKKLEPDSDSEFELTLEEPSDFNLEASGDDEKKGDIFEATDFEIPALEDDSASEAVSLNEADTDLESSSDFDLALEEGDVETEDESASEVVALDDEDVEPAKPKKKAKKKVDDDDDASEVDLGDVELEDEDDGAAGALRGVRADEDEDDDEEARPAAVAGPAKWGPLPAILMAPTFLVLFLGGLMAYELLHSVWGYQQSSKPTTPLVSFFAEKFDLKPAQ